MISPQVIYEGSYGMELTFTINKPLSADSTYTLYIKGPSNQTVYVFSSASDFQDMQKGVLVYTAEQDTFPIKGRYQFQLSEERSNPPQKIYSTVVTIPVHDTLPIGD